MKINLYVENPSVNNIFPQWITLPMKESDLESFLNWLFSSGGEETIITDYEAPFPINQFVNLKKLNEDLIYLNKLKDEHNLNSNQVAAILADQGGEFKYVFEIIENFRFRFYEASNEEELGFYYIHSIKGLPNPKDCFIHYDYEATGRSLTYTGIRICPEYGFAYEIW